MKRTILLMLALLCVTVSFAQKKTTYKVAQRDTCDLYMDVYDPVVIPGDTLDRPTILYVFGGGFIMGQRDDPWVLPWFKLLNENGYRVVSVDYRLGLKGIQMRFDLFHLIQSADYTKKAVDMGVEGVFSSV
jgi:carboxylesterase type B